MTRTLHDLPRDELFVAAAPEICFQVVFGAGTVRERRDDGSRLVEFTTTTRGKTIRTVELVRGTPPERIDYSWVEGPLPRVEESIFIVPTNGGAILRYEGRFAVAGPRIVAPLMRRYVRKRFAKAMREHLKQAKEIAEKRAERSRLYPKPSGE